MSYNYRDLLSKSRRNRVFLTPQDFLDACADYFEWCEEHPLLEEEAWQYQGAVIKDWKSKVRSFTKKGLCIHIGIPESRLSSYRKREGWEEAVELVEQIIYTQKFENAAAGLLNSSIITRDLGLAEKQDVTAQVETKQPVEETPEEHRAIHVHPDDPDPLDLPRPLFSRAQLKAGIPFPI